MTYDPFVCDDCWGEHDHLPHCPQATPTAETLALREVLGEALRAHTFSEAYVP